MKYVAVALVFFVSLALATTQEKDLFKNFMNKYNKRYENSEELERRYSTFVENLKLIKELNDRKTHATFGVTQFADMSPEEFKTEVLSPVPMEMFSDPSWPMAPLKSQQEIDDMPPSWDWRDHGAVTPIKNQGQCGSCWSFSATGNMEGQWFLGGNTLVGLSEQNLVDCDHHCMQYEGESVCDGGCNGGLMPNAFMYTIANGGIDTESSYSYTAEDGTCKFNAKNVGAKFSNWTMLPGNETQMAAWLAQHGPISIAVDAIPWQFYIGGVFEDPWCGDNLDHGVLLVGYGSEIDWFGFNIDFWIVKNSWGTSFGESGYIRIERNVGECGDTLFPCSSLI